VIAMEPYGPPLVTRLDLRYYTEASLTTPSYLIYPLPLLCRACAIPGRAYGSS